MFLIHTMTHTQRCQRRATGRFLWRHRSWRRITGRFGTRRRQSERKHAGIAVTRRQKRLKWLRQDMIDVAHLFGDSSRPRALCAIGIAGLPSSFGYGPFNNNGYCRARCVLIGVFFKQKIEKLKSNENTYHCDEIGYDLIRTLNQHCGWLWLCIVSACNLFLLRKKIIKFVKVFHLLFKTNNNNNNNNKRTGKNTGPNTTPRLSAPINVRSDALATRDNKPSNSSRPWRRGAFMPVNAARNNVACSSSSLLRMWKLQISLVEKQFLKKKNYKKFFKFYKLHFFSVDLIAGV